MIKVDTKDFQRLVRWVQTLTSVVDDPRVMNRSIQRIGVGIDDNFRKEGARVRKWQNLTAFTQQTRQERGYPAAHPILQQSGGLRQVAARTFMGWNKPTYASSSDKVAMVAVASRRQFKATIAGEKVENQFGGPLDDGSFLPRRRFWFIDDNMKREFADKLGSQIIIDWGKRRGRYR